MIPPYRSTASYFPVHRVSTSSQSSTTSETSNSSQPSSSTAPSSPSSSKIVHFGPVEHIERAEPVSAWDDDSDDEEPSFIVRTLRHRPRLNHFTRRHGNSHLFSKDDAFIMRTQGEEIRVFPQQQPERPTQSEESRRIQEEIAQQYQTDLILKTLALTPSHASRRPLTHSLRTRSPPRKSKSVFFRQWGNHDDYDTWG